MHPDYATGTASSAHLRRGSPEWTRAWAALAADPMNVSLSDPGQALDAATGEEWRYVGSAPGDLDAWFHQFRHRHHPGTRAAAALHIRAIVVPTATHDVVVSVTLPAPPSLPEGPRRYHVTPLDDGRAYGVRDGWTDDTVGTWNQTSAFNHQDAVDLADALERSHHGLPADRLVVLPGREWSVLALLPPWTDAGLLAEATAGPASAVRDIGPLHENGSALPDDVIAELNDLVNAGPPRHPPPFYVPIGPRGDRIEAFLHGVGYRALRPAPKTDNVEARRERAIDAVRDCDWGDTDYRPSDEAIADAVLEALAEPAAHIGSREPDTGEETHDLRDHNLVAVYEGAEGDSPALVAIFLDVGAADAFCRAVHPDSTPDDAYPLVSDPHAGKAVLRGDVLTTRNDEPSLAGRWTRDGRVEGIVVDDPRDVADATQPVDADLAELARHPHVDVETIANRAVRLAVLAAMLKQPPGGYLWKNDLIDHERPAFGKPVRRHGQWVYIPPNPHAGIHDDGVGPYMTGGVWLPSCCNSYGMDAAIERAIDDLAVAR